MEAALVILDGWGIGESNPWPGSPRQNAGSTDPPSSPRDAVYAADTPNVDRYTVAGATCRLRTDGPYVGLPDGQSGNSEVGHLTIGAGRVVPQVFTRIERAIEDGTLSDRSAIADAFEYLSRTGGRLHVLGLLSDGGVHADHRHMHALIEAAADRELPAVSHPFTDGRDTSPTAGSRFLNRLESVATAAGTGQPGTVSGRYYAMDRDRNWERTTRAYEAMVCRRADRRAADGVAAVEAAYDRGETDEFVEPTLVADRPAIADGDAVIVCNFRADRARQLTRMLGHIDPVWPTQTDPPDIYLATMTEYDERFDLPVAFNPRDPGRTLGSVVAEAGRTQLRIAESEKYAHVTYFLNGGRETTFEGELREIVPSPDVPTYDLQPEMHAAQLTNRTLDHLEDSDPDLLVLNYANPDMVGHTGDYEAAKTAVEAVDREVGRLVPRLREAGAHVLITADHGNADDMGTPEHPHTAHTLNPVPLIYLGPQTAAIHSSTEGERGLAGLAPTVLELQGVSVPEVMAEKRLFRLGEGNQ